MAKFEPVVHTSRAWSECLPIPNDVTFSVRITDMYHDPHGQLVMSIEPSGSYILQGSPVLLTPELPDMPGLHLTFPENSKLYKELLELGPLTWEQHEQDRLVRREHKRRVDEVLPDMETVFRSLISTHSKNLMETKLNTLRNCCETLLAIDLPEDWRDDKHWT